MVLVLFGGWWLLSGLMQIGRSVSTSGVTSASTSTDVEVDSGSEAKDDYSTYIQVDFSNCGLGYDGFGPFVAVDMEATNTYSQSLDVYVQVNFVSGSDVIAWTNDTATIPAGKTYRANLEDSNLTVDGSERVKCEVAEVSAFPVG